MKPPLSMIVVDEDAPFPPLPLRTPSIEARLEAIQLRLVIVEAVAIATLLGVGIELAFHFG